MNTPIIVTKMLLERKDKLNTIPYPFMLQGRAVKIGDSLYSVKDKRTGIVSSLELTAYYIYVFLGDVFLHLVESDVIWPDTIIKKGKTWDWVFYDGDGIFKEYRPECSVETIRYYEYHSTWKAKKIEGTEKEGE